MIGKQKTLKKITMATSVLAMGIGLAAAVSWDSNAQSSSGTGFYSGFSMGQVWRESSGTLSATIGGTPTGVTGSLGGSITGTRYDCCLPSNAQSACNFSNENAVCKSGINRPSHTDPVHPKQ
ncbi:hypothetical protein [Pedobacter sp. Hv1]|uniref:hypothetical protein n=1 Tax=Pedobacter sp. Hv1 TaxID=1740090 RepID=UPI0006D8C99B|nr:hypothetical protein [Pedobacter sp. Hv1]KQB99426.1 hypothetical protein AQF98_17810 [Pedobacter sp. Hv1]